MSRFVPPSRLSLGSPVVACWRGRVLAALRVAFALLWACNAWLTCQPVALSALHSTLMRAAPHVSAPWPAFWLQLASANLTGFALSIALLEACVAVGLFCGLFTNLSCALGIALALLSWSIQGTGLIAPAGIPALAGDPGIVLATIFSCIGLSLSGAGFYSGLDRRLSARPGFPAFLASGWDQPAVRTSGRATVWPEVKPIDNHHILYPVSHTTLTNPETLTRNEIKNTTQKPEMSKSI